MAAPLDPPINLNTRPKSSSSIFMTWVNGDGYDFIEVWENRDGAGYVLRETIDGEWECYNATGLDPVIPYCYRVLGGTYDPPEESDLSIADCSTTFATLEPPSDLEVIAFSNFIEIIWKDNSSREDDFRLWRKVGAGDWAEYQTVPANVEYYRDTSVTPGTLYAYRVLARDGEEDSDPSNEDSAVALNAPSIPTSPTLSEVTDKEMRFSWIAPAADEDAPVTGYRVQISDEDTFGGEETEYIVGVGVLNFLFRDLIPNDTYYARVCAYNGVGNSPFTDSVNDTTDEQYEPTEFEKWIRKPGIELVALCEMNLGTKLTGFNWISGQTYTYELAITDRAINDIEKVFEDGEEYTEVGSINDVEATASTFFFHTSTKILYVHTSTGADPSGFYIEGWFWLHIKSGESATFNGDFYYPLLSLENIPSMSSEVSAWYGGSFTISAGTTSLKNDEETCPKFFDKRFADYLWQDAKLVLKIGGPDFTYSQFKEAFTSLVDKVGCNDKLFNLNMKDLRANLDQSLPMNKYWLTNFPDMDEDQDGKVIPKAFGYTESIVPTCINKENKQWKFHDIRIKEVHGVKINPGESEVEAEKDVNFYVDYQRGIITFDKSFSIDWEEDIVEIHFTGAVDSANESVVDGTEIFRHIMFDIIGLSLADLDHDSIYQTKYASSINLAFPIHKQENLTSIIHKLENSIRANTFQDEKGRIGLQTAQTTPASKAVHVKNFHIATDGHSQEKGSGYLFKEINIFYKEDVKEKKWEIFTKALPEFVWKYGKTRPLKPLDVYTYFYSGTQASALADDIATKLTQLEAGFVNETLPWILYGCRAGDLIILSRDRFYSSSGEADEITVKLLKLDKAISSKQSTIKGVVVS